MFRRVLVANRGEIALRVVRSLRELGIESVVIHGREDRMSLPVRLADEGFYIPSEDPLASYLDIEAIVSAAKEVGADATFQLGLIQKLHLRAVPYPLAIAVL